MDLRTHSFLTRVFADAERSSFPVKTIIYIKFERPVSEPSAAQLSAFRSTIRGIALRGCGHLVVWGRTLEIVLATRIEVMHSFGFSSSGNRIVNGLAGCFEIEISYDEARLGTVFREPSCLAVWDGAAEMRY